MAGQVPQNSRESASKIASQGSQNGRKMVSEITVYIIESGGRSGATNGSGIGFERDWDFANPSGSGLVVIQASIPRDPAVFSPGFIRRVQGHVDQLEPGYPRSHQGT